MYVVDGYNLLHAMKKFGGLPADFGRARARVVELLSAVAKRESVKVRVFFDGTPGELGTGDLAYPRVKVTFSGPGTGSADEAVREFVAEANNADRITVVSSDIEVVKACKLAGARVMPSQAMAEWLSDIGGDNKQAPSRPEKPIRGMIGDLEREMLDEIGDYEEFQKRIERGE
jgi:predicted RNA-binding protein with PIN domain